MVQQLMKMNILKAVWNELLIRVITSWQDDMDQNV